MPGPIDHRVKLLAGIQAIELSIWKICRRRLTSHIIRARDIPQASRANLPFGLRGRNRNLVLDLR